MYEKLIFLIKSNLIYNEKLSSVKTTISKLYFNQKDSSVLILTKSNTQDDLIVLKTEIDHKLLHVFSEEQNNIHILNQKNLILEKRVTEYKDKFTSLFNNTTKTNDVKIDTSKLLTFFENNVDVGILITDLDGKINNANYFAAQLFGYVTSETLITNNQEKSFQTFLKKRQETIEHLIASYLNRYEHIIEIDNYIGKNTLKEVIIFYPNVHNPQKIISLFYTQENDIDKNDDINQFLLKYMIKNIKSYLNTIEGYNNLQTYTENNILNIEYIDNINKSCQEILVNISEIMNIKKISLDLKNIQKSIFKITDLIEDIYEKNKESNIEFNIMSHDSDLLVISDKTLFFIALNKLLSVFIKTLEKNTPLNIKIIDNINEQKINILISINTALDLKSIHNTNFSHFSHDYNMQYIGNFEYKIAQITLETLGCKLYFTEKMNNQNWLNIEIADEMITNKYKTNTNNIVI
jgi:PAS domain-containing protein